MEAHACNINTWEVKDQEFKDRIVRRQTMFSRVRKKKKKQVQAGRLRTSQKQSPAHYTWKYPNIEIALGRRNVSPPDDYQKIAKYGASQSWWRVPWATNELSLLLESASKCLKRCVILLIVVVLSRVQKIPVLAGNKPNAFAVVSVSMSQWVGIHGLGPLLGPYSMGCMRPCFIQTKTITT